MISVSFGPIELEHDYYKDLCLDRYKKYSSKEIKKAYYELMLVHHTDRGGNKDMATSINIAYEILSEKGKYNSFGKYKSLINLTPKEYFDFNNLIKYQGTANPNFNREECLKKAGINFQKTDDYAKKSSSKSNSHDYKQSHKTTEDSELENVFLKLVKNIFDYTTSHKVQTAGCDWLGFCSNADDAQ